MSERPKDVAFMAVKFGKREKIIVGVVAGIAAVFAVHTLVFKSKAGERDEVKQKYDALVAEVQTLPKPGDKSKIDLIDAEAQKNLEVLWKTVLRMGIVVPPYLTPPAAPTWPEDTGDVEKLRQFTLDVDAFQKGPMRVYGRQVQAVLTEHARRLVEMKKAYEAGKAWKGDALVECADMSQGKRMKLTFLGSGPLGWDLPEELPAATMVPKVAMKDQIDRLYDYWDVLSYLSQDSPDFIPKSILYLDQLNKMGLNTGRLLMTEANIGKSIPSLVKLMWVHLIWSQKGKNETFYLRQGQELTHDMLTEMFAFEMPTLDILIPFARQLDVLERVVSIARKSGVEDIQLVQLPSELRPIASYVEADIKRIKDRSSGSPAPSRDAGRLARTILGGGGAAGPGGASAAPPPPAPPGMLGSPGYAVLLTMGYMATNEASVRFLYNLTTDPQAFRIEGLEVWATKEGKVVVALTVDATLLVNNVSALVPPAVAIPGEILNYATGQPLSEIGKDLKKSYDQKLRDLGLDMDSIVEAVAAEYRASSETLHAESAASTETLTPVDASTTTALASAVAPTAPTPATPAEAPPAGPPAATPAESPAAPTPLVANPATMPGATPVATPAATPAPAGNGAN